MKRRTTVTFFDVPESFVFSAVLHLPSNYMQHNCKSCPKGRRNWALTKLFLFCVLDVALQSKFKGQVAT